MSFFKADLHCHSTCSDGSLKPTELVELAVEKGLNALSITDHDNIDAYQTALPAANLCGLKIVSGVEFSSVLKGENVHILGYSFAVDDPAIKTFCQKHRQRRLQRNSEILALLAKHEMPISEEELQASARRRISQCSFSSLSCMGPHI